MKGFWGLVKREESGPKVPLHRISLPGSFHISAVECLVLAAPGTVVAEVQTGPLPDFRVSPGNSWSDHLGAVGDLSPQQPCLPSAITGAVEPLKTL